MTLFFIIPLCADIMANCVGDTFEGDELWIEDDEFVSLTHISEAAKNYVKMASSTKPIVLLLQLSIASVILPIVSSTTATPTPTPWPLQFHSILFMNYSGSLQKIDLWYDWPNGRNFNIIQDQLDSKILYDLEWNNGTSFFYTLDSSQECRTSQVDVGILRPNWLDGANYLGQLFVDGFLCNVWEKVDFIWYSEDVVSKRPVHWVFYSGREAHVMTFEVGAVLEDAKWQAPVYCFDKENESLHDDPNIVRVAAATPGTSLLRSKENALVTS